MNATAELKTWVEESGNRYYGRAPHYVTYARDVNFVPVGAELIGYTWLNEGRGSLWDSGEEPPANARHIMPTHIVRKVAPGSTSTPAAGGGEATTREKLQTFLYVAAGEGFVLSGVDAADLFAEVFPAEYAAMGATTKEGA